MANPGFDGGDDLTRHQKEQPQGTEWHPDLSREHPEWKLAHAKEKDAALDVSANGVYTVKDGDTIYDIARRALASQNNPTDAVSVKQQIGQIIQANVDQYPRLGDNPDLIHAGDQLKLCADSSVSNVPALNSDRGQQQQVEAQPIQQQQTDNVQQTGNGQATDDRYSISNQYDGNQDQPVDRTQPILGQNNGAQNDGGYNYNDQLQPRPFQAQNFGQPNGDYQYGQTQPRYQDDGKYYSTQPSDYGPSGIYRPNSGENYLDQEATRLSQMMAQDPHGAANEMRDQLSRLDPSSASALIAQTKNYELVGGLGDLQVQCEFDQYGRDTGYRNVTMATPDGIEQIAEIQSRPQPGYGLNDGYNQNYGNDNGILSNPLAFAAGVIVGDLLWQRQRGVDFNDDRYRGWCNREQNRENYWNNNNGQFIQNWQNPGYRQQYQNQNWQQVASNPNSHNTYITNNRYDTTINNTTVNNTVINETINNTKNINNSRHTVIAPVTEPMHRVPNLPPVNVPHHGGQERPVAPGTTLPIAQQPHVQQPWNSRPGQLSQPGNQPPHLTPGERPINQNNSAAQQQAERERAAILLQQQQDAAHQRALQLQQRQPQIQPLQPDSGRTNPDTARALQQQQQAEHDRAARQAHELAVQQQQQQAERDRATRQAHELAVQQQQQQAERDRAARQAHELAVQQQQQQAERDRVAREAHDRAAQKQQPQPPIIVPPGHKA